MAADKRTEPSLATILGAPASATDEVVLALDDPETYVRKHAKALAERRVTKPRDDLAWIALVDALAAAKKLVEIDVHTEAEEVVAAVRQLAPRGSFGRASYDEDLSTAEVLETIGKELAAKDLSLAHIDLENDSLALVVLPSATIESAFAVAPRDGIGALRPFTGAGLGAATKQRHARAATRAEELAPPANKWRGFLREEDGVTHGFALQLGERAIDVDEGVLGKTEASELTFKTPDEARARATELLSERRARGFAEVSWDDFVARYKEAKVANVKKPAAKKPAPEKTSAKKPASRNSAARKRK